MRLIARWQSWRRGTFRRAQLETEMDAEVRFHLDAYANDLIRAGMPREEALRRARLEFGAIERSKEECREARGVRLAETLWQDVRYGARMLRKSPGFTLVAVLTIALGIGANTAIFSLVNGILLVALPYAHPEQLVSLSGSNPVTYPRGAFVALREQVHTMEVAAYAEGHDFNLSGSGLGEAVRVSGTYVSAEFFEVLGMRPALGRTFRPGEDLAGQDNYVILSYALWQQLFHGDPGILGRSIRLEGGVRQVAGVMPADFRFPSNKTEIWIPLHNDSRSLPDYWAGDFMPVIGRLHEGVSKAQADAEMRLFQAQVGALFPWQMPTSWNAGIRVVPLQAGLVKDVRTRLLILLGAVGLVLLIACTNVANLTLSRAATREKEIMIRAAMGAERGRIVSQLLTESVVLAGIGALLGLVFAAEGLALLKTLLPADTPRLLEVHIEWRVLLFTTALAILTGVACGLAPAWHASRGPALAALKSGTRGAAASVSQRLRGILVAGEVAFAVLLVIGAGLMIRSFWALSHGNPGFQAEHLLTARITPNHSFCDDVPRCLAFYGNLLDETRAFPATSSAALINTLPLDGRIAKRNFEIENFVAPSGEGAPLFWLNIVSPDYFRVMNIPLLGGRAFDSGDLEGAPVAIITAETARRYFPSQSAVGKHIRLLDDAQWRTVVGVIPDVRAFSLEQSMPAFFLGSAYIPYNSKATMENHGVPAEMTIALRTSLDDAQAGALLRQTVKALNQEIPVSEVKPMGEIVSEAAAAPASTATLFVVFAAVALLLGVIGIYGVLSYLVSRRTREIGIRLALGAQRRNVLWLILKEGTKFSLAGTALGLGGAFGLTRLLANQLYGVSPADPVTYGAVAVLMLVVTLLACYVPTRRAMRTDPLTALRAD